MKPHLTARHKEIIRLISLGCTNKEAGAILGISPYTVDNHKSRIMQNLGVGKAVILTRITLKYRFTSLKDQLTKAEKRKSGRKNDGWN